jgi:uncharacterized protein YndB with AHSA1/START domain
MTNTGRAGDRILGDVRSVDGTGIVRMQDRYDTDIEDLWSALTDPRRLARWLGTIEGDLQLGGEFRAHFFASGWEGTGRVQACDPPNRLLVVTNQAAEAEDTAVTAQPAAESDHTIEVSLTADGSQTILVWEERGMPPELLAAYGAGIQVHVEDLAAYLSGRDRCDAQARWSELEPA